MAKDQEFVSHLRAGKRVRGDVYIHRDAVTGLNLKETERLRAALELAGQQIKWNVARIGSADVSLLEYEEFERAAFPQLLASVNVKLTHGQVKATCYRERSNRPILHRKELLLAPDDPRTPQFAAVTRLVEQKGLFKQSAKIGTTAAWAEILASANLEVRGAELVDGTPAPSAVQRHRTALVRRQLSQPMALALRLGIVSSDTTVFDYGCGRGDDVAILQANGFEAFGWDPHFAADAVRRSADTVNLGFVLNVIEDPDERADTLRSAWSFAKRALIIAVMNRTSFSGSHDWKPFKDGVITSRGTFQRYFSQGELRTLVAGTLDVQPLALAPGVVAVFRDRELEQEVVFRRHSSSLQYFCGELLDMPERPEREHISRASFEQQIGGTIDDIWRVCLQLGRLPSPNELGKDLLSALQLKSVSPSRAIAAAGRRSGSGAELSRIAAARREDLLVHFALSLFPGAPTYSSLPRTIQLDVKAFFSSHSAMLNQARAFLFALGKGEVVRAALDEAIEFGLAAKRREKVRFAAGTLEQMPAPIRLLVGCGEVLEPDLASADFFDAYLSGDRIRGLWCEDASARAPLLREMVDVQLSRLKVRKRDRSGEVLYGRGALLPREHPEKIAQVEFDNDLIARGVVDADGRGPDATELKRLGLI